MGWRRDLPAVEVFTARERARRGEPDDAIPLMRAAVDHLFREGLLLMWGVPATGVLVETLLDRGTGSDMAEAEAAIERLATAPADEGLAIRDIWLLRLRALLARAHGDAEVYKQLRDRYRDRAKTLGFEGHIVWAEAMPLRRRAWFVGRAELSFRQTPSLTTRARCQVTGSGGPTRRRTLQRLYRNSCYRAAATFSERRCGQAPGRR